jgi:hypothetical protein
MTLSTSVIALGLLLAAKASPVDQSVFGAPQGEFNPLKREFSSSAYIID